MRNRLVDNRRKLYHNLVHVHKVCSKKLGQTSESILTILRHQEVGKPFLQPLVYSGILHFPALLDYRRC